jgi:phosphate transport system substrate-binding protein
VTLTYRAGAAAGLLAAAVSLAACSSSGSSGSNDDAASSSTTATTSAGTSAAATGTAGACASGSISSDGSSAQANAMTAWVTAYQKKCPGATINYTGTSSGQGVSDFTASKIAFAGSDAALDKTKGEVTAAEKACGSPAIDIPMVVGPIAIGYNVSGVSDLTLNADVLAKIFTGKITTWSDPAIAAINSGAKLPSTKISVFFRGDPSGTSKNFESYLAATAPTVFTATPDKPWPYKTGSGVQGSSAIADGVKSTDGGIGYMEWSYAGNKGLKTAKVDNGGGAVALSAETAGSLAGTAQIVGTGDDLSLKLDYATKQAGVYPIELVTYEIVCTKYKDAATGALVKSFLTYTASSEGQGVLAAQGYGPLPSELLSKVQASVAKIS